MSKGVLFDTLLLCFIIIWKLIFPHPPVKCWPAYFTLFSCLFCCNLPAKVPCELARYAGATAPASCQGKPLKPLYIRKLAGFFKCLFYFRLKIQYIFYIYGWFSQLHFCQYPALPEKPNWLSGMLFLFLAEKTAAFFVSGWLFQTTFCAWKNRFLLMTDI